VHRGRITSVQFIRDGRLVSASSDNTLLLWKIETDNSRLESIRFERRSGDVAVPGISLDGKRLLFDMGRELRVLSLPEGQTEGVLQNLSGAATFTTMALFSPDGQTILTASTSEKGLQLWRAPGETVRPHEIRQLVWKGLRATCGAFAP